MSRRAALVIVVLIGACRLQFGKWQGAPPRAADKVRVVLTTKDDQFRAAVEAAWRRDPKVELSTIDPDTIGRDRARVCTWARAEGYDFIVEGSLSAAGASDFKCTKYEDLSILDTNDPDCIESEQVNRRSTATMTVSTYDAAACERVSSLSGDFRAYTGGDAPENVSEVRAQVVAKAELGLPTFPAQVTLDESGRITGDEPGFYAIFRDRTYIGTMQVDDVRAPGKMLTCCHEPRPGDPLVRRGRVTQISLDISGTLTQLRVDGDQRIAGGAGLNIRHYKMDGGLEVTLTGESITAGTDHGGGGVLVGTAGWGFRPNAALRLSAHAGGGLFYAAQSRMDMAAYSAAPVAWFGGRAIFTPVPWLYIGADVGYYASAAVDDWEGDGKALADPMALRAPMVRVFAGLSQ